jgi:single-stranded-DNA-specific exonuclease
MEISELVRSLLSKRGIENESDIAAFLNPDYVSHLHDPRLFSGMEVAVERTLRAIHGGERIAMYADYDCDGIPGAALLLDLFTKIGYANVEVYLPHRDREGYGFHKDAIEALAARGAKLIITIDVGTTAVDAVRFAKEKGVDVIITDHHEITGALPEAIAVLNPKLAPYPFPHLCGAGVAFKFAQALLNEGRTRDIRSFVSVQEGWEKWLLDLVAVATVADMVPLVGENRVLAHFGLQVLRKSQRPGINALCNMLRLKKSELTEDEIGFSIAPRINAASRMDEPDLALTLLTTRDSAEAELLAAKLEKLNASRKGVVAGIVREARKRVRERFTDDHAVVVLGDPEWKPALLGLAANSVMQERGGVVCLWGRDALGRIKGSCRSDGVISVTELFASAAELFEEFGGHEMSGGFSVSQGCVHELPHALAAAALALAKERSFEKTLMHDSEVRLPDISWLLFRDVLRLAPFGAGNAKPMFLVRGGTVTSVRRFGKETDHVEVLLASNSGAAVRAFDFFKRPEDFSQAPHVGEAVNVLATLERDTFRGPARLALRLVDVLPA